MTTAKPPFSATASGFIDSVLRLRPQFVAFDCDGTLWTGDAGEGFFDWELRRGLVSDEVVRRMRARYADYLAGKVSEDDMCGEMATMNEGLEEEQIRRASREFFDEHIAHRIFPEMRELVANLKKAGCDVWAVSSTSEWVIREGVRYFGIPADRILAAEVEFANGRVTDRLVRIPSGEGKPRAIREVAGRDPDAAFGNSRWDAAMLEIAKYPFAINPNPDLEKAARDRNWPIYFPDAVRKP
jgi:HAD superfamily phosphoserine phosphatase-like hydrolase